MVPHPWPGMKLSSGKSYTSSEYMISEVEEKYWEKHEMVLAALTAMVCSIADLDRAQLDPEANLFELGMDSLELIQLSDLVNRDYGVYLELSQIMEEANTLNRLAAFVSARGTAASSPDVRKPPPATRPMPLLSTPPEQTRGLEQQPPAALHQGDGRPSDRPRFNFRRIILDEKPRRLTKDQQAFIADLIARYNARTSRSKDLAQRHRTHLSDWINTLAFRKVLKELVYPIASASSFGSRLTDIDGNEYLDLAMGFGVAFFGHAPPFITQAIQERLGRGLELATQIPEAGEAAEIFCRLTGLERVTFCNTGSEAVMMALRIARTVTGRERIVLFAGSYHGTTDGVLALADETGRAFPTSPGIPLGAIGSVSVLPYGTEASLAAIRAQAGELAAILVEPVQSRRPGFQPREFLRELRSIADQSGAALIFDEMITGFRTHPGGVQALFGIRADIATYGKAAGGGMPISMVAGSARFLDAVDGGFWRYGDDSKPEKEVTFFGGTFCRHPLAMAASLSALRYMEGQGPALQEAVNRKTDRLAEELNTFFTQEQVPMRLEHFGSLFRFESFGRYALMLQPLEMDLFFYLLMNRGIFTWERRICFLSTAHSDEDVDQIIAAVKESIRELREGGFGFEGRLVQPLSTGFSLLGRSGRGPEGEGREEDKVIVVPMSSTQKRIYILSQYDEGDSPYHLTGAALVEGPLDVRRLTEVFEGLIQRHESLRTSFTMRDGALVQCIHPIAPLTIEVLQAVSNDPGVEVRGIVDQGTAPYRLSELPLMRMVVVRFSDVRFILFIDIHHIAADGFSTNILMREFVRGYTGESLPPLTFQVRDQVEKQNRYFLSLEARRDADWFMERLAAPLPTLNLPWDFPRPPQRSFSGDLVRFRFNAERTNRLKKLARDQGTTLFMLLLTAFYTLLYRLSGEEDIIVGVPIANRDQESLGVIGLFAETLPVRVFISGSTRFAAFLKQMSRETFQAFDHQRFPLEHLLERLNLQADISRNPLFDVAFVFEKADDRVVRLKDLTVTPLAIPGKTAMFDLSIEVAEEQGELSCFLEYSTSLFTRETAERWTGYYQRILEAVTVAPETPIAAIDMIPPEELFRLQAGGETIGEVAYRPGSTIVQALEEQVQRTPGATALIYSPTGEASDETAVSYSEMNRRANCLARYLLESAHLRPGALVAIPDRRSPEMIVALLAISKAGTAYLPLERSWPEERLRFILKDSGAVLMLSDRDEPECGVPSINIGRLKDELSAFSEDNLPEGPQAGDLAYVIYTSGSTGLPKGCLIEHGSLRHYLSWFTGFYRIGRPFGAFSLFTTIAFDLTLASLYPSLLVGRPLHLYPDSLDLTDMLRHTFNPDTAVDCVNLTPSHISLIEHLDLKRTNVGLAIVGGEPLTREQVGILRRLNPAMRIYNEYGPTECTIGCIATEISADDQRVVIGRPIAGTEVFILDADLRPLPTGVSGEICLGGIGLARGYLNRPELTAEKFVAHPFRPEGRIYRTGDLGLRRMDGNFECLGRGDDQVKIRGYRIELGEIEQTLLGLAGIKEASVIVREVNQSPELAAFVTGDGYSAERLRRELSRRLPEYMIPQVLVILERMPLTPNGKVDRQALRQWEFAGDAAGPSPNDTGRPPGNDLERGIARIWEQVLQRSGLSRDDNFFAIGGQSLKAVQAVGRIQKELGLDLKLGDFFRAPTIRELASLAAARGPARLEPIEQLEDQGSYILSHGQKRLWLLDQREGGSAAYNMSGAWWVSGDLEVSRLQRAVQAVVQRHEILRTTFELVNGEPRQKIHKGMAIPFREVDLSKEAEAGQVVQTLLREEELRPFDLSQGPLLRILLLHPPPGINSQDQSILALTMHHIISDGWSVEVLVQELSGLYRGRSAEDLPPLPIQYKDYAAWQQRLLSGSGGEEGQKFWRSALAGAGEPLPLPIDFPRPEKMSFKGAGIPFGLDRELTANLHKVAAVRKTTLFVVLLAAIKVLLYGRTGQENIIVGTPVAGRDHPDLENQIGLYINTLPLLDRIEEKGSFANLLAQVRTTVTEAFAHQFYPFDRMVEDLDLKRHPGRNPLFDVLFVLQNREENQWKLGDLDLEPIREEALMSKFDLIFNFQDQPELSGYMAYSSDLFFPETIASLGRDLIIILDAVTADCSWTVKELDRLLACEQEVAVKEALLKAARMVDEDF
ncbi:MAG: amino acid adenylation domain-containing protein [Pseudomonadota bacterium]